MKTHDDANGVDGKLLIYTIVVNVGDIFVVHTH
jgi:hypothetical protein